MPTDLLATKFYIPPARLDGVSRPRLTEKLLACLNQPGSFTLVTGPAGFGKTTLLSEFVASLHQPVAWFSLDEGDNDPIRFWSYLVAACRTAQVEIGETALAMFRSPMTLPAEAVPASLINDFASLNREMVLILDDYHSIHNETIQAAMAFLLEHLPANLHLLVSTRVDPPWPLARFRARNQLVEVRAQNLRFTTEEAAAFLNQMMGLNLTAGDVAALGERTEGWAAGLQLAALSMQGRNDIAAFVKAFTGSHVYIAEYLMEEVLQRQPGDVQTFLLQTSLLERMNASLVEAETGCVNGQAVLAALHRANLFVISLDDEGSWFRYHHLFADLLNARLRQSLPEEAISGLHQKASAWYEQAGMPQEAIKHALKAADYACVVRLVEKVALPVMLEAQVRTVESWLLAIPQQYFETSPRLNMAFAWMYLLRGFFDRVTPYMERAASMLSTHADADQDASLQGEWLALQSRLLNEQGKPAESRDLALQALKILPEADTYVRSMLHVNLATAYQQMLDYSHAAEAFHWIVRDAQAAGDHVSETLGTSGQAQMLLMQGRLHQAFAVVSEGIRRLEAYGKNNPFGATLYGEIGQIHYYWHQLDQARNNSQRSMQISGQSGYSDPQIFHNIMLSKIYQMEGDWDAASREMQKASDLMRIVPPVLIREEIVAQQVRIHLAFDRLKAAEEALEPEGFSFDEVFGFPELLPGCNVTHPVGLLYNSALRVVLFKAVLKQNFINLQPGVELAGHVFAAELQGQHIPVALETLLLRSQMYTALGDNRSYLTEVSKALELAEPEGFISVFVEEGRPIAEALRILLQQTPSGSVRSDFIKEILAAFPDASSSKTGLIEPHPRNKGAFGVSEDSLVEALTNREMEILLLIAAGDSNRTIAEKLVITVSAVKKHTSNIYSKLNINSRTQALARARQLGLLPASE